MAKWEGTQSIPSELLDLWRATLTDNSPKNITRKRYPFRRRLWRKGGYKVTNAQKAQRQRFLEIIEKFKTLSAGARARWYSARPEWSSLLWYYNYFILSGLMGNANIPQGGCGVIKDINHYTFTLPSGAPSNVTVSIDTCDPGKAIAFFYGAGYYCPYEGAVAVVYPYLVSLNSSELIVKAPLFNEEACGCSVSVIEYI